VNVYESRSTFNFFNLTHSANPDTQHLPNPENFDDIVDLLSLCNLMELSNILFMAKDPTAIMPLSVRKQFIQARKSCRKIVDWIGCNFEFHTEEGEPIDFQVDVCAFYLARQAKTLVFSKVSNICGGDSNFVDLECAIIDCFSGNAAFEEQWKLIQNWTPDTLALDAIKGSATLGVMKRTTPLCLSGETGTLFVMADNLMVLHCKIPLQERPATIFPI